MIRRPVRSGVQPGPVPAPKPRDPVPGPVLRALAAPPRRRRPPDHPARRSPAPRRQRPDRASGYPRARAPGASIRWPANRMLPGDQLLARAHKGRSIGVRAATRNPAPAWPARPDGHAGGSAPGSAAPKSRRAWSRLPHLCHRSSAPASGSARGHHTPGPVACHRRTGFRSRAMKNPSIPPRSAQ